MKADRRPLMWALLVVGATCGLAFGYFYDDGGYYDIFAWMDRRPGRAAIWTAIGLIAGFGAQIAIEQWELRSARLRLEARLNALGLLLRNEFIAAQREASTNASLLDIVVDYLPKAHRLVERNFLDIAEIGLAEVAIYFAVAVSEDYAPRDIDRIMACYVSDEAILSGRNLVSRAQLQADRILMGR